MRIFVVRLNPDTRSSRPYSKYPTTKEYKSIRDSSPMNGFHEAVNFLAERGVVRGYLPPKHLVAMRTKEPFALVTITAKTAKVGGDMLIGIQAGCRYEGDNRRTGGTTESRSLDFYWHYSCPASLSMLLSTALTGARSMILSKGQKWGQGPTYEIGRTNFLRLAKLSSKALIREDARARLEAIVDAVKLGKVNEKLASVFEADFESQVAKALTENLDNVVGNKFPRQIQVHSYQYQRDPKVVAYALKFANGVCGHCKLAAPFISNRTGLPYLEVHHKLELKHGGSDTTDNVIALCPNCHRRHHHEQTGSSKEA